MQRPCAGVCRQNHDIARLQETCGLPCQLVSFPTLFDGDKSAKRQAGFWARHRTLERVMHLPVSVSPNASSRSLVGR